MKDVVEILDLRARTYIGINDWEQEARQEVVMSIWLTCDTRKAAKSDDIADAVNYRDVARRILDLAEGKRFNLVERLAGEIAETCCREFGVSHVKVRIEKPNAVKHSRSVGVTIERDASDYPG